MGRYFLFSSGGRNLAVGLSSVREVVGPSRMAKPIGRPEEVPTVLVDGEPVPLWKGFSGEGPPGEGRGEVLVILEEKGLTMGIFTDSINEIKEEPEVTRHDLPRRLKSLCRYFEGLIEWGNELYFLMDVGAAAAGTCGPPTEPAEGGQTGGGEARRGEGRS